MRMFENCMGRNIYEPRRDEATSGKYFSFAVRSFVIALSI
jgi:hypothetical protein